MLKKDSMPVQKIPDFIEKRLLEEYREQGFCWRHDDEMLSKLTAVLLPLSIAALTLPYLKHGAPKLLAAIGGIMLMTFWFLRVLSYEDRLNLRWSRIHEIERLLALDSHLRIDRGRAKSLWKGHRIRCGMFIGYIFVVPFVMCGITVESMDPELKSFHRVGQFMRALLDVKVEAALWTIDVWTTNTWIIKLFFTVETIIIVTISLILIDVCTLVYAWKRGGWKPDGKSAILKIWHKIQSAPRVSS